LPQLLWKAEPAMIATELQHVADTVVRRAQRQRYVLLGEIQEELVQAGYSASQWKEIVALSRPALRGRRNRYYYRAPVSPRLQQEQRQRRAIHQVVRQIFREHRHGSEHGERREHGRTQLVLPIKVRLEDGRELTVLSRDLSPAGIRLIGTHSLLGQKLQVAIPRTDGGEPSCLRVRILWTSAVADGLFENGGTFLEMVTDAELS
jgi:hypothetical protein